MRLQGKIAGCTEESFAAAQGLIKRGRVRFGIVAMLFIVSATSYGDRIALSIGAISFAHDLHLDPVHIGYLFSGFSWVYAAAQLPAGGLLDRYGSKRVCGLSIIGWSICALLAGLTGYLVPAAAFTLLFLSRLASGLAQSPVFPGNGRIVAAWFPVVERGFASSVFNSSQYFAIVLFAPAIGWITHNYGWQSSFWFIGLMGLIFSAMWFRVIYGVREHPRIHVEEVEYIEQGGGLGSIGGQAPGRLNNIALTLRLCGRLLSNRLLIGVYLGQFGINTLTWFFLTWFALYLSDVRHMSIISVGIVSAIPAFCGFAGGILGGLFSDQLLRMGHSLNFARKAPIVMGMCLAATIILCNFVDAQWAIVLLMSLAFFGKGFGALGWTVISDTSPVELIGLNGGMFNLIGNLAGIVTPVVIGYLIKRTGSFHDVLIFVGATAMLVILSYFPLAGTIRRLNIEELVKTRAVS